ncbi:hypothetical protein VTK56DRAFT_2269 [Thermocarpiscus australiensis]
MRTLVPPMLLEIALALVAAAALLRLTRPSARDRAAKPGSVMDTSSKVDVAYETVEWDRVRVAYGSGPGATVYGWPAMGGIYVLTASAVEIEFLGYERFKPVPHPSPATPHAASDEEAHCNKMRQLGAMWWISELAWYEDRGSARVHRWAPRKSFLRTGWPATGGVWVLCLTEDEAVQKNAGMIFNAYSMEERCQVIEQLGGTFYANPEDCPELDSNSHLRYLPTPVGKAPR